MQTILIADDNYQFRKALVEYTKFHLADLVVIEAVDGVEAIDMAIQHQPQLILLDSNMPEVDGYEAARQIRAHLTTAHIPIIAISGEAAPRNRHMSDFCDVLIQKPFDLLDLMKIIQQYLSAVE